MSATAISDGRSDLEALIDAAKKATPGPWEVGEAGDYPPNAMLDGDHTPIHSDTWGAFVSVVTNIDNGGGRVGTSKQGEANAAFIALANPSTVAAMASELLALREAMDAGRRKVHRLHTEYADLRDRESGISRLQAQTALDVTAEVLRLLPSDSEPSNPVGGSHV